MHASERIFVNITTTNNTGFKASLLLNKEESHIKRGKFRLNVQKISDHTLQSVKILWSSQIDGFIPSDIRISPDGKQVVIFDETSIGIYEAPGIQRHNIIVESMITDLERECYLIETTVGIIYLDQAMLYFLDNQFFIIRLGCGKRIAIDCQVGNSIVLSDRQKTKATELEKMMAYNYLKIELTGSNSFSNNLYFDVLRGIRNTALLGEISSTNRLNKLLGNKVVTLGPPDTRGVARAAKWALRYLKQPYEDRFTQKSSEYELLEYVSYSLKESVPLIDIEITDRQERLKKNIGFAKKNMHCHEIIYLLGYPDTSTVITTPDSFITTCWYYWKSEIGHSYKIIFRGLHLNGEVEEIIEDGKDPTPLPWQLSIYDMLPEREGIRTKPNNRK